MSPDPHRDFRQAVECTDDMIDLGRAALTLALGDYPGLDIPAYLARIDQLARAVSARLGNGTDVYHIVAALNYVLFQEQGFHGNRDYYYDPKNSFLNEVIERKTGIPITLSVLYMEVAKRVGLSLDGVGFPGHFLVRYRGQDEELVLDPYDGGEIRSREHLEKMLYDLYGGKVALHPDHLQPVSKKQILKRMLTNLKVIYLQGTDLLKGLAVMERLVILDPDSAEDIRDRGAIYLRLECFQQALADLETYLRLAPKAEDTQAVRDRVVSLQKQVAQIH